MAHVVQMEPLASASQLPRAPMEEVPLKADFAPTTQ